MANRSSGGASLFINRSDLYDEGSEMNKLINKDLRETIDKMASLKKECDWEGTGFEAFFGKFDESMQEMYKMCNRLSKYGDFMQKASGEYERTASEVTNNFSKNRPSSGGVFIKGGR